MLLKYIERIATLGDVSVELEEVPNDASTLAFLTAIVLQTPLKDKQSMLSIASLAELLRLETQIIARESSMIQVMLDSVPNWLDNSTTFTPN